jgi:thimet oligopeptidase
MLFLSLLAFLPLIHSAQEASTCLPMTEEAIEVVLEESLSTFDQQLQELLKIPENSRTFDNTVRAYDLAIGQLNLSLSTLYAIFEIHPQKTVRDAADLAYQRLNTHALKTLATHPEIHTACSIVKERSSFLSEENQYVLDQQLKRLELSGMQLPTKARNRFAKLQEEIATLQNLFTRNIIEDSKEFYATKEELRGLDESWLKTRKQNEEGAYQITADLPTRTAVLSYCSMRDTRKAMDALCTNRAFPQNEEVLKKLFQKQEELAQFMGFQNFAAFDLSTEMAGSIEKVETFLAQVKEGARVQSALEFQRLSQELPPGVALTPSGQLESFDELFVDTAYKKKHFSLDPNQIAEYFPIDETIQGLIQIYEQFFNLSIREAPHSLPIPEVRALEIRDVGGRLLGVVFLDLFPREGKCSHSGVMYTFSSAFAPPEGPKHPAICLVLCNMNKPSPETPALILHRQVVTFFHEFGHAIHAILGGGPFLSLCGTKTKRDFVELPSQLLEKWIWDPSILKMISSHYLTKEPLSDEQIASMLQAKAFGLGQFIQRLSFLSELSLAFYKEREVENPTELMQQIWAREMPHLHCPVHNHFHTAWVHIASSFYGPKYYSYLWSQIFAQDVFEKIREGGLLNPKTGAEYAEIILSKGGRRDPNLLLQDYLGREPSIEPFFRELMEK